MPQLFIFGPELFIVGKQTIVNKDWTTYVHRLQIQRFQFFLTWRVLSASFLLDHLIVIFLELLLVLNQWKPSTFLRSTSTSSYSKTFSTVSLNLSASVSDGIPNISGHSRLGYCSLPQHLRSNLIMWLFIGSVTDLDNFKSVSSLL